MIKKIIKKINFLFQLAKDPKKYFEIAKSQNNNEESEFLKSISHSIQNKFFIEIGFHNLEFNCIGLIEKNFKGTLLDGGRYVNTIIMKIILLILNKDIAVNNSYITTENIIHIIKDKLNIGCISIDIDGNDYWITKKMLENEILPEVFVVEYNPSFLNYAISVPYSKKFNRFKKHKSGLYHGASLKAFEKLFNKYDYSLIKVIGGVNAFFIKKKIMISNNFNVLTSENAYEEGILRNKLYGSNASKQFETIKNMEFIKV